MPRRTDSAASNLGTGTGAAVAGGGCRESDEESEDQWDEADLQPMSDFHKQTLRSHRDQLIELVNPVEVLIRLESSGVLSKHEMQEINKDKNTRHDKNELLLDHLLIKADSAFDKLLQALAQTNQIHIACLLRPGYHKTQSITPKKKTPKARRSAKKALSQVTSPQSVSGMSALSSPAKTSDDGEDKQSDEDTEKNGLPVHVKLGIDSITQQHSRTTRNSVKQKKDLLEGAIYDNLLLYRSKQQQLKKLSARRFTPENTNREKEIQESMKFLLEQNEKLQNQLEDLLGIFDSLESHGRSVCEIDRGSILFSVLCPSLRALEDLNQRCQGPQLKRLFQKLITADLMENLALTAASLKVNIDKTDYLKCKQLFLNKVTKLAKRKHSDSTGGEDVPLKRIKKSIDRRKDNRPRTFRDITNFKTTTKVSTKPTIRAPIAQDRFTKIKRTACMSLPFKLKFE